MSLEPWKEINMARVGSYDKEFKESIIQYVLDHPDETYVSVGKRFDVHSTTIGGWMKEYKEKVVMMFSAEVVTIQVMKLKNLHG